jgi:hypothetical protein
MEYSFEAAFALVTNFKLFVNPVYELNRFFTSTNIF